MRLATVLLVTLALMVSGGVAVARGQRTPGPAAGDPVLLGSTEVQAQSDSCGTGCAEAFGYTAAVTGTATSIDVYLTSTDGVSVGLYADNGSQQPGALLASGSVSSNAEGWV